MLCLLITHLVLFEVDLQLFFLCHYGRSFRLVQGLRFTASSCCGCCGSAKYQAAGGHDVTHADASNASKNPKTKTAIENGKKPITIRKA